MTLHTVHINNQFKLQHSNTPLLQPTVTLNIHPLQSTSSPKTKHTTKVHPNGFNGHGTSDKEQSPVLGSRWASSYGRKKR